jgi:hypothetical protein
MFMWYPGQAVNEEVIQLIIAALDNEKVKAELSKRIRVEMDNERTKYRGTVQSYDSLTSGNVNMQARMAASGYDVYGRTVLQGNKSASNQNVYKKMKNQIKYGTVPHQGYRNRGDFSMV